MVEHAEENLSLSKQQLLWEIWVRDQGTQVLTFYIVCEGKRGVQVLRYCYRTLLTFDPSGPWQGMCCTGGSPWDVLTDDSSSVPQPCFPCYTHTQSWVGKVSTM